LPPDRDRDLVETGWPFLMSKYCAVENQSSAMLSPGNAAEDHQPIGVLVRSGEAAARSVTLNSAALAPTPMASDRTARA